MSEQILYERLGELCAILKANKEADARALDDFLSFLYQSAIAEYNTAKIKWEEVEGPRGVYERASEDTLDFNLLVKDLARREGKLTLDNQFYWKFDNANVVGRKQK